MADLPTDPKQWTITRRGGSNVVLLQRDGIDITARIEFGADPGDGTVPAAASAAAVNAYSQISCEHTGYEHGASYGDITARQSVLDAIIRMVEPVTVK